MLVLYMFKPKGINLLIQAGKWVIKTLKIMIEGEKYIVIVNNYFKFLFTEFNFKISKETVNGNFFYDVQFKNEYKAISISYENIENYLRVVIYILENGQLPHYNNLTKILPLNQINKIVLPKIEKKEHILNDDYFSNFTPIGELERQLLKSAKELRLCLKYF